MLFIFVYLLQISMLRCNVCDEEYSEKEKLTYHLSTHNVMELSLALAELLAKLGNCIEKITDHDLLET